jgi:hypothetical protein
MIPFLMASMAWAGLNDGGLVHHKQKWVNGTWLHDHDNHCDDSADYWAGGSAPWHHRTTSHGLVGTGNTSEWLTYTICPDVPSELAPGIATAFTAYGRAGVYVQPVAAVCEPLLPTANPNDHPSKHIPNGWFATRDADGKYVFDDVHGIHYASSDTDANDYLVGVHFNEQVPGLNVQGWDGPGGELRYDGPGPDR